jgi:hypothetical protein
MSATNMPKPGDRVGFVCGPSSFPADNAGLVIATYSDRWYDNQALILMDDGRTAHWVGSYSERGIGCHLIRPAKVSA